LELTSVPRKRYLETLAKKKPQPEKGQSATEKKEKNEEKEEEREEEEEEEKKKKKNGTNKVDVYCKALRILHACSY
jgi:hypothetical protein